MLATIDINTTEILLNLIGGLAVFLYGMSVMSDSLQKAAGDSLRSFMSKMTSSKIRSLFSGTAITALTQSSSVTTVLLVGFVSAGIMTVQQSVGVIMGASVGSTITAQIIAFKVQESALLIIALALLLRSVLKKKRHRELAKAFIGLGLIFLGMQLMSQATYPLRDQESFSSFMLVLETPLYALLLAAIFTAIVQSSAVTIGLVIIISSQGLCTLETGIIILFGANIGTCATALLASIGKPRAAVQVAVIHLFFKTLGVAIWLPFIRNLTQMSVSLSPNDIARQVANAHTLLNIINACLFLPFASFFAKSIKWVVPDKEEDKNIKLKYIHPMYLSNSSLAIEQTRLEITRLAIKIHQALANKEFFLKQSEEEYSQLQTELKNCDILYQEIISYLREIALSDLEEDEGIQLQAYSKISVELNSLIDTLAVNWLFLRNILKKKNLKISEATTEQIDKLYRPVLNILSLTIMALKSQKRSDAREVNEFAKTLRNMQSDFHEHLLERLQSDDPNRLDLYLLQSELSSNFQRFYEHCRHIAQASIDRQKSIKKLRREQEEV